MRTPYIGITDFTDYEQVQRILMTLKKYGGPSLNRRLHVGVMMSYKTLNDHETKWSKAFPAKETIANIFASREAMNCLHYADYESIELRQNLTRAIRFGDAGIHALQLDMVWPNPQDVADALQTTEKKLEVILQVGANAIEKAGNNTRGVVKRLAEYMDIVDYVLIDKSMGRGLEMNVSELSAYARAISVAFPNVHLVAAGGLGPKSIALVEPLVKEFPNISIDAQSKLRPSGSALDPIDWDMAEAYIISAIDLFK